MIEVRVLFFGATADAVGDREITIQLDTDETVEDVVRLVKTSYDGLASMKLLSAVNEEYAGPQRTLVAGDSVALFTTVSGG